MWSGTVHALHLAPRSFLPMRGQDKLVLLAGIGVEGDRYATGNGFYSDRPEEGRQVTLFEVETLEALARDHKVALDVADHRRNITTRGVPLNHLVGRRLRIGDTLLEGTRLATPCRHIEQITGQEIFNLLLNRSGLHAKIITGGAVRLGDGVTPP